MIEHDYFLAQRKDNDKWDILDANGVIIETYDTQEEGIAFLDRAFGDTKWEFQTIKDETDGTGQVILEKHKANIQ